MDLKPYYSNINVLMAFRLAKVSYLYNHAFDPNHAHPSYTHKITKISVFGLMPLLYGLETLLLKY